MRIYLENLLFINDFFHFYLLLMFIYLKETECEQTCVCAHKGEAEREREREREPQAGFVLSAQSQMWASIPPCARSWSELKSTVVCSTDWVT